MSVITFRRTSNIAESDIPVIDGQILFDTYTHKILMDNGSERIQYGGTTDLISTTPEALTTNAYNAVATNQIFLQKTTVVDTKANALAVTQSYIPLGCLAFKEAVGTTNYSSIGNGTISGALVKLNNQLVANGLSIYMDYKNGKYGYNTDPNRGADTFTPFKRGLELVGTYTSNTSINVSSYNASSVNEFVAICDSKSASAGNGGDDYIKSIAVNGSYTAPTLTLSGNTLTINVGKLYIHGQSATGDYPCSSTQYCTTYVYYVG